VDVDGAAKLFLLNLFAYKSATSAQLGTDLSRLTRDLLTVKARPRAGCTDNCSNVLRAIKKLLLAVGGADLLQLLHLSCAIHTSLLVLDDLAKRVTDVAEYLRWLKDAMSFMHRPRIKHDLQDHVREKMPMMQESKWNAKVKASR
jgi:hypothetical protein